MIIPESYDSLQDAYNFGRLSCMNGCSRDTPPNVYNGGQQDQWKHGWDSIKQQELWDD